MTVGVGVAVVVKVTVGVQVGVAVGVKVGVKVKVTVGVKVKVTVGVMVGVKLGVLVGVNVKVTVGVKVNVIVGVKLGVNVGVAVGVKVKVTVGVVVGVKLGVGVAAATVCVFPFIGLPCALNATPLTCAKAPISAGEIDSRKFPPFCELRSNTNNSVTGVAGVTDKVVRFVKAAFPPLKPPRVAIGPGPLPLYSPPVSFDPVSA